MQEFLPGGEIQRLPVFSLEHAAVLRTSYSVSDFRRPDQRELLGEFLASPL